MGGGIRGGGGVNGRAVLGGRLFNNRKIVDDQNGGCGFLFSKYRVTKGS